MKLVSRMKIVRIRVETEGGGEIRLVGVEVSHMALNVARHARADIFSSSACAVGPKWAKLPACSCSQRLFMTPCTQVTEMGVAKLKDLLLGIERAGGMKPKLGGGSSSLGA